MRDRYGDPPLAVASLMDVARFRGLARRSGLTEVTLQSKYVRFFPVDLQDSQVVRLTRLYPGSVVKAGAHTILVPRPSTAVVGGQPIRDAALLDWARKVIQAVLAGSTPA